MIIRLRQPLTVKDCFGSSVTFYPKAPKGGNAKPLLKCMVKAINGFPAFYDIIFMRGGHAWWATSVHQSCFKFNSFADYPIDLDLVPEAVSLRWSDQTEPIWNND